MNNYCLDKFLADQCENEKKFSCGEHHLYITNFDQSVDRNFLVKEFRKFGEIRKIFIESRGKFAKVYFHNREDCYIAAENFKTNLLGWRVIFQEDSNPSNGEKKYFYDKEPVQETNMYEDCQVINGQYVNVFGDPIEVVIDDNNELYVSFNDVKSTGFTLFKRSEYDILRNIDRTTIVAKEFDLFMLSQASEYLLDRMITFINNEDIIETINRCRSKLGIDAPPQKNFQQRNRHSIVNPYNNNISVSIDNQESRQRTANRRPDGFNSRQTDGFNSRQSDGFNNRQSDGFNSRQSDGFSNHRRTDGLNNHGHDSRQKNREGGSNRGDLSRSKSRNKSTNSNASFTDDSTSQMRPPKNLPTNFGPTHTQRLAAQQPDNSRRTSEPNEFQDNDQKPEKKRQEPKKLKNFETQSQASNSSGSSLVKRLEIVDTIEKVSLEVGQTYIVRVVELEKENICWVHETESCKNIDELELALDDIAAEAVIVNNVNRGQLALAEYEGAWGRCRVINMNPLNVLFIDYGNRADVTDVKELSPKFRKTPALACRLAFNLENSIQLKNDMELKVKIKQKYDDDTYFVIIDQSYLMKEEKIKSPKAELPTTARQPVKQQEIVKDDPVEQKEVVKKTPEKSKTPQQQPEKHYFDVPEPLVELHNGDKVMLIDLVGNKFAVKTKECVSKSKEILEYIKSLNKCELMMTSVKESQLVLCSKDGLPNLCRGIVKKKDSPTIVTVNYLDYPGEDQLSVKSLRNVDEHLAREPCTLVFTPEFRHTLTDKSVNYIDGLFVQKEKATVVIDDEQVFDLQMEDKTLLSAKLLLLEEPEKVESKEDSGPVTSTPNRVKTEESAKTKNRDDEVEIATPKKEDAPSSKKEEPITYDDMPFIQEKVGSTGNYMCYNITDVTELTLIPVSEEVLRIFEIINMLEPDDDVPFEPEIMEMCLVSYQGPEDEEATWHRAVVLDKEAAGYAVSMVDFGTPAVVKSEDIRKLPRRLKDLPIIGILCALKDVPNDEKCNARVKELLPEGEEVKVKVLEFIDELKYVIDIPDITEKLKKEGLCK